MSALGLSGAPIEALLTHREAVAGNWLGATDAVGELAPDEAGHLKRCPPDIRAWSLDQDLLSSLQVRYEARPSANGPVHACSVWHVSLDPTAAAPAATVGKLVDIARPPLETFKQQLDLVDAYADLRGDRAAEIASQIGPQGAYWETVLNLRPWQHRATLELALLTLRIANTMAQRMKLVFSCRRPVELSAQIQPMLPTPGHGAFPSGHANEAFAVATVLGALASTAPAGSSSAYPAETALPILYRQAHRIATNRTVAGLHFPVDHVAGQMLGLSVAHYLLARCGARPGNGLSTYAFDGNVYPAALDHQFDKQFDPTLTLRLGPGDAMPAYLSASALGATIPVSPLLQWLWQAAKTEWA